jgi:RNA polymerase sigma-70 factor (ECF subfamily)
MDVDSDPRVPIDSSLRTESELVTAARDGDRDAFRDLYLGHVRPIFGFLASRTDVGSAEELTAETFARAYAAIGRFRVGEAPFRAWLFRIARNLVIERARRKRVDVAVVFDSVAVGAAEDLALASDEARRLRQCLEKLPESHATVLELRFLRELSVRETALVLSSSDEAIRALTYRALQALRRLYEDTPERQ